MTEAVAVKLCDQLAKGIDPRSLSAKSLLRKFPFSCFVILKRCYIEWTGVLDIKELNTGSIDFYLHSLTH